MELNFNPPKEVNYDTFAVVPSERMRKPPERAMALTGLRAPAGQK